jgi:DNA-binding HxlR family transcriptional regulator
MQQRRVLNGHVIGVEYALTPLGQSLQGPFSILFDWTLENIDMIQGCQRSYDAREDASAP